jgi:hypothetical protein
LNSPLSLRKCAFRLRNDWLQVLRNTEGHIAVCWQGRLTYPPPGTTRDAPHALEQARRRSIAIRFSDRCRVEALGALDILQHEEPAVYHNPCTWRSASTFYCRCLSAHARLQRFPRPSRWPAPPTAPSSHSRPPMGERGLRSRYQHWSSHPCPPGRYGSRPPPGVTSLEPSNSID